ncbi:NUDIX hydrolase [Magnetospirillum sp. UT-4]|uniref:NUDIX hydrolase n=1 Tax=Magnetospirillum sp. UT-4 TaxID=2681467 RepID=UPI001382E886|nr:NUDIX domain-containing protein [Magnetospirillum sp. UT-4]CAA7611672.1 RNA pyrophosphohydrolase (modular protein) [Magnetospirillum sp. UT-4]
MRTSVWVAVVCPPTRRVLVAKRAQVARNAGMWNFFGGGLDRGEVPLRAARRELHEEAGLLVPPSRLVPLGAAVTTGKRNLLYGLSLPEEFEPVLNEESDEGRWLRLTELKSHHPLHEPTRYLVHHVEAWLLSLGGGRAVIGTAPSTLGGGERRVAAGLGTAAGPGSA